MSAYSLTNGSGQALALLMKTGGSDTLLLQRDAAELRAGICIEPLGEKLQAVITMGGTTNSQTLQARDPANARHLADLVEAIANGTADTAEEAPRPATALAVHTLLPCWKCKGPAIGFDYCAPGPGTHFVHGAKCQHNDCQRIIECASAADAADRWNAIQSGAAEDQTEQPLDMVNHPPHYTGHPSGIECIEVAEHLPFCLGNAFKYLFRRNDKGNALENVEKALWYVRRQFDSSFAFDSFEDGLTGEALDRAGQIVVHEPYPVSAAMLIIASPKHCGCYEACIALLEAEIERLRRVEAATCQAA